MSIGRELLSYVQKKVSPYVKSLVTKFRHWQIGNELRDESDLCEIIGFEQSFDQRLSFGVFRRILEVEKLNVSELIFFQFHYSYMRTVTR